MSLNTVCTDQSSALNTKSGFSDDRSTEWKKLMNEFLLETEIFEKDKTTSTKFLNLNFVMDERHKMIKPSVKTFEMFQLQIHSEALRLIRLENHKRLLKSKEGKTVEKEIKRLKHMLEQERKSAHQKVEELEKATPICRMRRKLNPLRNFETCFSSLQLNPFPPNPEINLKNSFEKVQDFDLVSTRKGSIIESETENDYDLEELNVDSSTESPTELQTESIQVESEETEKYEENEENSEKISNLQKKIIERRIKLIWCTWRAKTKLRKRRKKEKNLIKVKVDSFLSKLERRETEPVKEKKITDKHVLYKEKEEKLKKIMEDIKESQKEAYNKLKMLNKSRKVTENPKVLENMEKRREKRLKRRREIQEKREKLEKEKKKAQELLEEEKKRREEEIKKEKIRELKEKRRQEEERKAEEKRRREKQKANTEMARRYYRLYLMRTWGLRPWLELLEKRQWQCEVGEEFFLKKLVEKAFRCWRGRAEMIGKFKREMAEDFHKKKQQRLYFFRWLDFHEENKKKEQVAVDWNELRLTEKFFTKWLEFTQIQELEYLEKKKMASLYHERKLRKRYLKIWKNYPELKRQEIARENRKQKWREKVMEILPDYRPMDPRTGDYSNTRMYALDLCSNRRCIRQ